MKPIVALLSTSLPRLASWCRACVERVRYHPERRYMRGGRTAE